MSYYKLITLFIFIIPCILHAQIPPSKPLPKKVESETVDSSYIRIWYAYNALDITNTKTYDDLQRLDIGEHLSKYYSFFVHNNDSLVAEWKITHPLAEKFPNQIGIKGKSSYWNEYRYSEYFKDFSLNTFTEYCRMPWGLYKSNCYYTEEIPAHNWEISEDTSIIAGYHCQKAICAFRGREYIAWFSIDIPINNGPWKFGGLPGLILKVYDKDSLFVFECISIEYKKAKIPITLYNDYKYYRKRERKDVLRFQQEIHKNYTKALNTKAKTIKKRPKPHEHEHMELE